MRYGLGAAENPDTNVYFADGTIVPDDYNTTYGSVSGGTYPLSPYTSSSAASSALSASGASAWLNANSTMVMLGAGAFVLLMLVAKAGR